MYKIYVNETPLCLANKKEAESFKPEGEKELLLRYSGKKKFLLNVIDMLEKSKRFEKLVVTADDAERMWSEFQTIYKLIEAAGGVVFNEKNEALLIFRRGHWDLPKGKIDKGETPEEAAVREVQEETGLGSIFLGKHLTDTYHTYEQGGKRILKRTWWYSMKTSDTKLKLQHEEDIERAAWENLDALLKNPPENIYPNVLEVLEIA